MYRHTSYVDGRIIRIAVDVICCQSRISLSKFNSPQKSHRTPFCKAETIHIESEQIKTAIVSRIENRSIIASLFAKLMTEQRKESEQESRI